MGKIKTEVLIAIIGGTFALLAAIVGVVGNYISNTAAVSVAATESALQSTGTAFAVQRSSTEIAFHVTETAIVQFFASQTIPPTVTAIVSVTPTEIPATPTPLPPTPTFTWTSSPTLTLTPTERPTETHSLTPSRTPTRTNTPRPTATRTPTRTNTPRPTPLGMNGVLHADALDIELVDYRLIARNSTSAEAVWIKLQFTNTGREAVEVRFTSSDLYAVSDDGDSYSEFTSSFKNYIDSSTCIYIGEWNWPEFDVTLYLEAGDETTYEFSLHRDGVDPTERCPQSSDAYVSRVSIGSNWIDISLPLEYQSTGERAADVRAQWRLER